MTDAKTEYGIVGLGRMARTSPHSPGRCSYEGSSPMPPERRDPRVIMVFGSGAVLSGQYGPLWVDH